VRRDFYFDGVSQIRMDCWLNGRVVLVENAACGPTADNRPRHQNGDRVERQALFVQVIKLAPGSKNEFLNSNLLDLVERDLVVRAVVELGRAGTLMRCHGLGVFKRAAIVKDRR
jgi:hypothetical protein